MNRNRLIKMLLKRLGAYLLSIVVGYALATVVATQFVVASLREMGVEVGLAERLGMTLQDLQGMAGMFMPMVAFGYLVAFLAAGLICRWKPAWRTPLYVLAGAVAFITIHVSLNLAFGVHPIAVGRGIGGLLLQGVAGAAGGWVFARLMQRSG